jgi:hypothetical protein
MTVFYKGPGATLIHGDATRLTEYVEPESVDLIVTSPPYFALRSYQDGGEHYDKQIGSEDTPEQFLEALWTVTEQCAQVLKPSGSMFINLGDKYAGSNGQSGGTGEASKVHGGSSSGNQPKELRRGYIPKTSVRSKSLMGLPWRYALGCIDGKAGDPLILRAEIIWHKLNALPESVTDRVRRNHEQWFHFTREGSYFSGVDEIREPTSYTGGLTWDERKETGNRYSDDNGHGSGGMAVNPLGKLPGSVWSMALEPLRVPDWLGVDHFAAFPTEWPRKLISGWSPFGFCIECNEPRTLLVQKESEGSYEATNAIGRMDGKRNDEAKHAGRIGSAQTTITGYACACDDTKAPTRPAVVLDPFGGTGTVAMVARALGREALHIDLSTDYLKLAKWRVFESGQWAKAVRRTNEDNQQTLDL